MKVVFLYFLFAFVEMSELSAQLSGIYTVGSKHHISDFKSLQEVFDTLEKSGVSGPVTIKMLPETYQGLFSLGYVPGANDLNRIIIESYSGDSSSVILTSNGTSNGGTVSLWGGICNDQKHYCSKSELYFLPEGLGNRHTRSVFCIG